LQLGKQPACLTSAFLDTMDARQIRAAIVGEKTPISFRDRRQHHIVGAAVLVFVLSINTVVRYVMPHTQVPGRIDSLGRRLTRLQTPYR